MTQQALHLPCMDWPETKALIAALVHSNIAFKFVGGCVRDALLGHTTLDIDIATSALPQQVQSQLSAQGIRVIPTGIEHGTVTALVQDKKFEITTLRKDLSTDGRHAVVAFTDDWQEDAKRRDFTLNALYVDAGGTLTDYFSGAEDAKNGIVRFIGDAGERIKEDGLRILRFFRFSARYAKAEPDAQGIKACASAAAAIDDLSGERIQTEMFKLLNADRAGDMLEAMQLHGILKHITREHCFPENIFLLRNLESHLAEPRDALRTLALLLRSASTNSMAAFTFTADRWKLSGAHKKTLQHLLIPLRLDMSEKETKAHIRKMGAELFIQHLLLSGAEQKTSPAALAPLIKFARTWPIPTFPLSGDDLLARGFKSGAELGKALSKLESEWETSDYSLSKEALLKKL